MKDGRGIYEMRRAVAPGFLGGINFTRRGLDTEAGGNTTTW